MKSQTDKEIMEDAIRILWDFGWHIGNLKVAFRIPMEEIKRIVGEG
jgi:hypothetical protein